MAEPGPGGRGSLPTAATSPWEGAEQPRWARMNIPGPRPRRRVEELQLRE